jgi:hypothetical protein
VNDGQVIIKNVAKVLAPVLVLSLFPVVNGSVANAANAPSITIGSKQLVNDLLGAQLDPSTSISNWAWNNLRAALEGARMTRCSESGNIYACQFVDRYSEPFTLLWTREGTSAVNVAGLGSAACGLEFADSRFNRGCSVVRGDTITVGMLPVQVTNRLN